MFMNTNMNTKKEDKELDEVNNDFQLLQKQFQAFIRANEQRGADKIIDSIH